MCLTKNNTPMRKRIAMKRPNWQSSLNEYLSKVQEFAWGENDCCKFCAGAVKAMTGKDYALDFESYKSKSQAYRLLKKYNGVGGVVEKCLGQSKNTKFAKYGDVVMFNTEQGDTLGICVGTKIVAVGNQGMAFLPMSMAKKVWSI